jgi:hypothetical protein
MFEYCRRILCLRENEAYLRITVARGAREHPVLVEMLRDGQLYLSGIARLVPHLTRENAEAVLKRASGMSHREIRELVAELEPRPDVAPAIRKLPERPAPLDSGSFLQPGSGSPLQLGAPRVESDAVNLEPQVAAPARPALVEPLAPARYQVRFTASTELREKLERLQALMRAPRRPTAISGGSSTSPSARSCSGSRRSALARPRRPERLRPIRTPAPRHVTSPQQ